MADHDDLPPLNRLVWTRRAPMAGRVYPILMLGRGARVPVPWHRGYVLRPDGWRDAVREGWVRAVRPLDGPPPVPPLAQTPAWARN